MSSNEPLPGGKKIVKTVDEKINVSESSNPVLQKLFEKDPILKDLFEQDKELEQRINEREIIRTEKLQSLEQRIKKSLKGY
jgi:hypothetical protein